MCSFKFQKMVLLKYFNYIEPSKEKKIESALPRPDGPLALSMPSSPMARPLTIYRALSLAASNNIL